MKAANETNASLVDAVYYDITDSACLEAKWENREKAEVSTGRGPTPVELLERSSRRQIGRAKRFNEENETNNESFNPDNARTGNSQPQPEQKSPSQAPKSKRKRLRLVASVSCQRILKNAKEKKKLVCISKLSKNNNFSEVEIKHGITRHTFLIGNQFSCDCSSLKIVNRKACHHIVSVLLNLMEVGEGNQLIAQVDIGHAALMQMLSKVPVEIPHHLLTIDNEDRNYDEMLMQHPLFNRNETWCLGRK